MATSATIANLVMLVGEDMLFQDSVVRADGTTPADITDWSVSFVVHAYGDPSTVFVTKTVPEFMSM